MGYTELIQIWFQVIVRWSEWVWGVFFHDLNSIRWVPISWIGLFSTFAGLDIRKNCIILTEFQHIDGSARWLTSFNSNHTPHAGTLPSTGHCWPATQLLLCLSCAPEDETFCLSSKNHIDHAAIRNWPIKSSHWCFELITDCLKIVEGEYGGIRRTLWNAATRNHVILRRFYCFLPEESDKPGCHAGVI